MDGDQAGDELDVTDYRSDPMESPEGQGQARSRWQRVWDAYAGAVSTVLGPLVSRIGSRMIVDLVGFWLVWHLHGGFEGLRRLGMSRSTIYRRVALFRRYFGAHPDVFQMPGVTIDVEAYLRGVPRPGEPDQG